MNPTEYLDAINARVEIYRHPEPFRAPFAWVAMVEVKDSGGETRVRREGVTLEEALSAAVFAVGGRLETHRSPLGLEPIDETPKLY